MDWKQLKSGTDVRGTATEGVAGDPVTLTDEVTEAIAKAFVGWLSERVSRRPLTVSVGHDSRLSAPRLKAAVLRALTACGVRAVDCGLCSTPAMFFTTRQPETDCDGAVQLTASHHPFQKNGLKFFTREGGLEGADIADLLSRCEQGRLPADQPGGRVRTVDFLAVYSRLLVDKVESACGRKRPLAGLHIVVDAGNGAGGFYVERVLAPLGADTSGSRYLDPDGRFPNHIPNPENKEAMASVCAAVRESGADFGIIFDTDVDRAGAVDKSGTEINRNRLIALISAILLEEHPGATVVTDSVTSDGLTAFLRRRGGVHRRFKRGYKNVIDEAVRLNAGGVDCPLAIETSGHAALRENFFLDDGAYLVTRLLVKLAQVGDLAAYTADLQTPAEEAELRLGFFEKDFSAYGKRVLAELEEACRRTPGLSVAPDSCEGVRVNLDPERGDGWFLLRMSLHDPIMPLNLESNRPGGCRAIAGILQNLLAPFAGLDLSPLTAYLGA